LKLTSLDNDTIGFAVTGLATPSGSLYNSEKAEKKYTSGRAYDSLFVRQWDAYVTENKSTIWYGTLKQEEGKWAAQSPGLINALIGSNSSGKTPLESPVPPFGGAGDFDISKAGLVFVAKDPKLDPALHTKTDLYYLPLKTFTEQEAQVPQIVKTGSLRGYSSSPVFSPDAKSVAFGRMKEDGYESDKPRLLLIPDITDLTNVQEFYETKDGNGGWDLRPEGILWSHDGKELYVTAEDNGRTKVFKLPSSPRHAKDLPVAITKNGSVNDIQLLGKDDKRLFLSGSSLIDNSIYTVVNPSDPSEPHFVSSNSKDGKSLGLSPTQVSEIYFKGAGDYKVHAWVVKPSNFSKDKKYPLAYLIHGGPQGAWQDSWSTRWNPAVFAEQGYIVVTPNPTGSTGYGMSLQNGIQNNWGGRPYEDIVKGFEYIEANLPNVDTSRAVALGASYGGYMMNWIQGQPLGRKFKALVTHDGVFSTLNQLSSEELFFPYHDFQGTLWDNRENYERWDPAKYVKEWATPHLVIHNDLDYRLPVSEGLAVFNALQSRGVPSRFLTFPDENHVSVSAPLNSSRWESDIARVY
jgi:dipeptidyl aminopeptidase/acylaminoacyl peptidase